jgi:hypothetical protein
MNRAVAILSCSILGGCAALAPHMSRPIATWEGKNSIDAAANCVTKALDYNFSSHRPPLPGITHRAKVIEEGRVYEIIPETYWESGPFISFVSVRGSAKTIIELFILQ